ncbi:MAG: hypothetical protein FJZ58_03520 [Chlamydiae bacterium]|nr:hypothetical protein [Chlamydiota bacterium]
MKQYLTNESLRKQFRNNFTLTNYAIALGRYHIRRGDQLSLQELVKEVRDNPTEQHLENLEKVDREGRD